MQVKHFFDQDTATFTYVVDDGKKCAIIDPVLNYNPNSGKTSTRSADEVIQYLEAKDLELELILETHIHADHLTAASYLKEKLGAKIAIGEHIKEVLKLWVPLFNTSADTNIDGSQFDHLLKDGETFNIGSLEVKVFHTPGHTPACCCYLIGNSIFVGDTIFMPYVGTARTDFPGGSAKTLYNSIQKIFSLEDETKIHTCHDYPPAGNEAWCTSTIAEQKAENIMINDVVEEVEFIKARNDKDYGKEVPKLLLPAIQFNLRAGSFGKAENNDVQYVKIPVNQIGQK